MKSKYAILLLGTAAAAIAAAPVMPVVWNDSPSVPEGIYRIVDRHPATVQRGQVVTACIASDTEAFKVAVERGYLKAGRGQCNGALLPVIKPVAAVAGDLVEIDLVGIKVNGTYLENSRPVLSDTRGRYLPRWPEGRYVVQPGEAWLVSGFYERSFDSRYWGPIKTGNILNVVQKM